MSSTPEQRGALAKNALGPAGIVFLVLAAVAPLTAMVVIAPLGIALGSGSGIPGSFLVVSVILLLFAVGYAQMSRHVVNAGAFYAYVTQAIGRTAGLATAFVAVLGYNTFVIGAVATSGFFTAGVFNDVLGIDLPWQVWSALSVVIVAILGRRGVDVSARILAVALIAESAILVVFDISVLLDGGFDLGSFAPSAVFGTGAGIGLLFAFTSFLGFEATAIFAEEARDPKRTIPKATYAAILIMGTFYVLTTLAIVSALGAAQADAVDPADAGGLVFAVANEHLGAFLTDVMQLLLVVSLFAALLALHNSATRYLFAMGRARVFPRILARTHRTMGSPYVASGAQMGLSAAVVAIFAIAGADPILVIVPSMTGFGTLCIIALQAAAAVAVVVFFRKRGDRRYASTFVAPALGGIGLIGAFVMATANFSTVAGTESPIITKLPWLLLAVVVLGVVVAELLKRRKPDVYEGLGANFVGDTAPDEVQAEPPVAAAR
jgi:amino acid transporter